MSKEIMFTSRIARKLISFHMVRRFAKRANPGLSYQINAIEGAAEVIQSDPEGFEGLESDLFNAHKSHKEYELEQIRQREKTRLCLVKAKYFRKELLPNLLTYAEKEQIKYLHSSDKDEWTIDKLADSFPANSEIISKIVKSSWTAISAKRVRLHDASVMRNWERFRNGEFKACMPKELEEHLKKFVNRNVNDVKISENATKIYPKKQWQNPTSDEFSSIISTSHKKSSDNIKPIALLEYKPKHTEVGKVSLDNETYLQEKIKNKRAITFHELKNSHDILQRNGNLLLSNDNTACNHLSKQKDKYVNETGVVVSKDDSPTCNADDFYKKFAFNEIKISKFDENRYGISQTKQRIHIPRKLWRKGATYRVNNCYYDDDGELLYKVPGIFLK